MRIDIITVLPELLKSPFEASILKRAIDAGLVEVYFHNLRNYTTDNYKSIDDTQFGGGAGMVMTIEPIDKCISGLKAERDYDEVIYMTPDGEQLNQGISNQISLKQNIIILCGHYKGVDQRVRDHFITREISIGDYVLSGGELPLPTRFKMAYWHHLFIPNREIIKVGKFPKYCSADILQILKNGAKKKPTSVPRKDDQIYLTIKNKLWKT